MTRIIQSLEARALKKRSWSIRLADNLTSTFGSFAFLTFNCLAFIFWVLANTNSIPGVLPFDPFPFPLLTTTLSLEAIILTLIVLMSQNRQSFISSLREEIDMQVNIASEREVTKVLQVLTKIAEKNGVVLDDPELKQMLKEIEVSYIEKKLQSQLESRGESFIQSLIERSANIFSPLIPKPTKRP